MSSRGTYVLQTYGEFRVAQVDVVDALFEEQDPHTLLWTPNKKVVVEIFKESKIYGDLTAAWDAAMALESEKPTDVGTSLLRQFETIKWEDIAK